jgi:hypothetical protein
MGGKGSKEKNVPEAVSKDTGKKQANPKGQVQTTTQIKGGIVPMQHSKPTQKKEVRLTEEEIKASQVKCLLDLFFSSERLKDLEADEDLIALPLKSYTGKSDAVAVMKVFLETLKHYAKTSDLKSARVAFSKAIVTDTPASDLFNLILTAFKLVRIEKNSSSTGVLAALRAMVELPASQIEGTEIETILFEGLLRDIDEKNKEDNSGEDTETKLQVIGKYLSSEDSVWPLCSKLPRLNKMIDQLITVPQEDLHAALETYIGSVKNRIVSDLEGKVFDQNVVGPFNIELSPIQMKLYRCLPLLSFGYQKIDGRKLLARVKKVALQIYREPDFETIRSLELTEFVSLNNRILGYNEPFFKSVTVESLVEKVAMMEDNPNLKSDFEPVCLYIRDNKVHYCLKKAALADRGEAYGNSNMMRLCLVKQHDFHEANKFRVVIAPNGILDSPTHFMYFLAIDKTATLAALKHKFETVFSNVLGSGTKMVDQLLASMTFSSEVSNQRGQQEKHYAKSAATLRKSGWDTPISTIIAECGQDNSANFDDAKENQADLVITLNKSIFKAPLQGNNWIDSDRSKFIKLKPGLTDLFEQVIGEDYRSNPEAYPEERIRELTPNYLYVDLRETANIFDVSTDLKFNFWNSAFEEFGMEYSPKYRAIGFVAQKKSQEFYTVLPDARYANKFHVRSNGKTEAIKPDTFDSNSITGIYYQRCTKEL